MTVQELSEEFNLSYNNSDASAPGLNMYEKSVFLTQAQEAIVKGIYSGDQEIGLGFEGNERARQFLSRLLSDYKIINPILDSTNHLITDSQFFAIPNNLLYIVLEKATLSSDNVNLNNKIIKVVPVTYDEFQVVMDNPFRKPNSRRALRVDLEVSLAKANKTDENKKDRRVELFAVEPIKLYHIRYLRKPNPIILTDFEEDEDLVGLGLTVDGENTTATSELNTDVHRDIVKLAVALAIQDYRSKNTSQK